MYSVQKRIKFSKLKKMIESILREGGQSEADIELFFSKTAAGSALRSNAAEWMKDRGASEQEVNELMNYLK